MTAVKLRSDGWPAVSVTDPYGLSQAPARVYRFGETDAVRQRRAEIAGAIGEVQARLAAKRATSQVSELSSVYKEAPLTENERELADLRRLGFLPGRKVLGSAVNRYRKYEIETGIMRDGTIRRPLEPWTCPGSSASSMSLYFKIMNAEPGTFSAADLGARDLAAARWMGTEQLIAVDAGLRIHPLSDAEPGERRAYPGAKCSDKIAAVGRYLRDKAVGLVTAALFNLSAGLVKSESGRAELVGADGMRAPARLVCAEANRLKSMNLDLDEYRYLSATRCAEIIRALIDLGFLDEIEPIRFERRFRSWHAVARVVRRLAEMPDEEDIRALAELVAAWDAERRKAQAERRLELAA